MGYTQIHGVVCIECGVTPVVLRLTTQPGKGLCHRCLERIDAEREKDEAERRMSNGPSSE